MFPRSQELIFVSSLPLEKVNVHPKDFTHYLSIIDFENKFYVGLEERNLFYSTDNANHSVVKSKISRAYYKLKECIERLKINLSNFEIAVDLGAAPGGWTEYLSEYVGHVYAIDIADMMIKKDNITPLKMKFEESIQFLPSNIDILVCDINSGYESIFPVLCDISKLVKVGGYLIITLKLPKRKQENIDYRIGIIKEAFQSLFPEYSINRIVWLLSNLNERCLVAQKTTNINN